MATPLVPNLVPSPASGTLGSSDLPKTLTTLGNEVLQIMLLLGGIISALWILYSAYRYITSNGDAEKTKAARSGIFSAIVGVIIIASAFTLVHFGVRLGSFVGIEAGSDISASDGTVSTDPLNQPAANSGTANTGGGGTATTAGGAASTGSDVSSDTYTLTGPGYSADTLSHCSNASQALTQTYCYPIILNDHDNWCAQAEQGSYAPVYCGGRSNDDIDKHSYCQAILYDEAQNGSEPYAPCKNV